MNRYYVLVNYIKKVLNTASFHSTTKDHIGVDVGGRHNTKL
jgi:hypothetical protein